VSERRRSREIWRERERGMMEKNGEGNEMEE